MSTKCMMTIIMWILRLQIEKISKDMLTKSKAINIILGIFLCFVLLACEKDGFQTKEIDSEIRLHLWELIEESGNSLLFKFYTSNYYPCCNYSIDYSFKQNEKSIKIKLKKIILWNFCLTSPGEASCFINVGNLSTGVYDIDIQIKNNVNKGTLTVTDSKYAVSFDTNYKMRVYRDEVYRIQKNFYWGEIRYPSDSFEQFVFTLYDTLEQIGVRVNDYAPGYYGYFTIDEYNKLIRHHPNDHYFANYATFRFDGKVAVLYDFLKKYNEKHNSTFKFTINDWKGNWTSF
ncbi:MAG: hypothetical protein HN691_00830 [Bacteroidetes bacterium]|nr:hypothetical protein [Bacteroidota bacterium]